MGVSGVASRPSKIITIKYYVEHTLPRMLIVIYLQCKVSWVSVFCVATLTNRGVQTPGPGSCVSKPCCPGSATQRVASSRPAEGMISGIVSGCRTFPSDPPALPEMLWDTPRPCYKCLFFRGKGRAAWIASRYTEVRWGWRD